MRGPSSLYESTKAVYENQGLRGCVARSIELFLREAFSVPKHHLVVHNQVTVRGRRLLDPDDVYSWTEDALVAAIREQVTSGDDVVILGGGRGVSTVWAARQTGSSGSVVTFELGDSSFETVSEALELNGVGGIGHVRRAAVGPTRLVRGSADGSETVAPTDLPACDVLELDCEGAELAVLEEMTIRPPVVIVETHGFLDATEADVRSALEAAGYTILDSEPEVESKGVVVLTARYTGTEGH